jgi:hypothetical protein
MTDNPKTWGEMTPEEKGALLLAHHEGKVIESKYSASLWVRIKTPAWHGSCAYRVKPEPKRETARLSGRVLTDRDWVFGTAHGLSDTHRITFDTIDGEPVCGSIRMEELT